MADYLSTIKGVFGFGKASAAGASNTFMSIIQYIVIGIVLVGIMVICIWLYMDKKKYPKTVKIWHQTEWDNCPKIKVIYRGGYAGVGLAGDKIFKVKLGKIGGQTKVMPNPDYVLGKEVWYFETIDKKWINVAPQCFAEEIGKDGEKRKGTLKLKEMDFNMALADHNIRDFIDKRHTPDRFWDKYGGIVMNTIFIVLVTICLVVLFQQLTGAAGQIGRMATAVEKMANAVGSAKSGVVVAP